MGAIKSLFSAPKAPTPPPAPEPADLEAEAEAEALAERERLRKGRVQTVLTGGQGLEDGPAVQRVSTVLGG